MSLNFWKIAQGINLAPKTSAPSSPANGDMYYNSTSNTFQFYQNGAFSAFLTSGGTNLFGDGTSGAPAIAFTSDTDVGFYRVASNTIGFASNATVVMTASDSLFKVFTDLQSVQHVLGGDGTVGAPGYSFSGDTDTGIYRIGSNNFGFATAGVTVGNIDSTGLWTIGPVNPTNVTHVINGRATVTTSQSGAICRLKVDNTTSAAGNHSSLDLNVAGTGVPRIQFQRGGAIKWEVGSDTASSDIFKIANGANIGTAATDVFQINGSGLVTIGASAGTQQHVVNGDLLISGSSGLIIDAQQSLSGASLISRVYNFNSASLTANAVIKTQVGGTGGGDPFFQCRIDSGNDWAFGTDNSDSDKFKISQGTALGTNDYLTITTAGIVSIPTGPLRLPDGASNAPSISFTSQAGMGFYRVGTDSLRFVGSDDTSFGIWNAGTNDASILILENNGSSTGDQYVLFREGGSSGDQWSAGRDDSDSGAFVISQNSSPGTNNFFKISSAGALTMGLSGQNTIIKGRSLLEPGSSASTMEADGTLFRNSQQLQNSGTGETDLQTTTVIGNTLNTDYAGLIYEGGGTLANNGNTKTLKLYFGTTSTTLFSVTTANVQYYFRAQVHRTGSGTQRINCMVIVGTAASVVNNTSSITDSSDQTAKLTGQGGASADITSNMFALQFSR